MLMLLGREPVLTVYISPGKLFAERFFLEFDRIF